MNRTLKRRMRCKIAAIAVISIFTTTSLNVFACLVPLKLLMSYGTYESDLFSENRRHNLQLLKFRNERRAAEAKFSQDMIDCANTPPENNCAKKAATDETRTLKGIQKQESDENTLHLNNLDKLATFYAFGKH